MKTKIAFKDVGRGNSCWTEEMPEIDDESLYKSVKKNGGIMSQEIDFYWDDKNIGQIVVGGFRVVGTFEVIDVSA